MVTLGSSLGVRFGPEVKLTTPEHLALRHRMCTALSSCPIYASMAWYLFTRKVLNIHIKLLAIGIEENLYVKCNWYMWRWKKQYIRNLVGETHVKRPADGTSVDGRIL
jgi:hypothetical protein